MEVPEIQSVKVANGYNTWNVTDFVAIENGGDRIVTLCIKDINDTGNGIDFYPKEFGDNPPSLSLIKTVFSTATDNVDQKTFSYSPNPILSDLHLTIGGSYFRVSIYDLSGCLVHTAPLAVNQKELTIAMGHYSTGMYVLMLEGNERLKTCKIIKK